MFKHFHNPLITRFNKFIQTSSFNLLVKLNNITFAALNQLQTRNKITHIYTRTRIRIREVTSRYQPLIWIHTEDQRRRCQLLLESSQTNPFRRCVQWAMIYLPSRSTDTFASSRLSRTLVNPSPPSLPGIPGCVEKKIENRWIDRNSIIRAATQMHKGVIFN